MPIRRGYIDAFTASLDSDTARTLESFGFEWSTFDAINPEDKGFWRNYFADVPLKELTGRVGLDAGCGKGRYAYFTAQHLKALVALDGSDAVKAAARNLASLQNVIVVKSDLRTAPFAPESFGFISCLGVLHHLRDPEEGFKALVRLLAPDGLLLLYVYSRPGKPGIRAASLAAAAWVRKLTVRMPRPAVRGLSAVLAPFLYGIFVIPGGLGERLRIRRLAALPLRTYRRRPLRSLWLDTFDRLSAPIEHRYLWTDIRPWFEQAGLSVEHVREQAGLFVLARRPSLDT
jgi:SAM-dependent methyltransferase